VKANDMPGFFCFRLACASSRDASVRTRAGKRDARSRLGGSYGTPRNNVAVERGGRKTPKCWFAYPRLCSMGRSLKLSRMLCSRDLRYVALRVQELFSLRTSLGGVMPDVSWPGFHNNCCWVFVSLLFTSQQPRLDPSVPCRSLAMVF